MTYVSKSHPESPPVTIGQTRFDGKGVTIEIAGPTPAQRWLVRYPGLDGEATVLSEQTIMDEYPVVVGGPDANYRDGQHDSRVR
jgi:hypothetical protein